jgi:SAM-dependent methyltransferase
MSSESASEANSPGAPNPGGARFPLFQATPAMTRAQYEFAARIGCKGSYVDFGCGYGFGTMLVADSLGVTSFGFDLDEACVRYAKGRFRQPNLHFDYRAEVSLPFESGSVGLVTCFAVIEHLDEGRLARFLQEVRRVLAPNGALVGATPNRLLHEKVSPFHIREFSAGDLEELARANGFRAEIFGQTPGEVPHDTLALRAYSKVPFSIQRLHTMRVIAAVADRFFLLGGTSSIEKAAIRPFDAATSRTIVFVIRDNRNTADRKIEPGRPPTSAQDSSNSGGLPTTGGGSSPVGGRVEQVWQGQSLPCGPAH